jgi:hypothetical protein
MLKQTHFMVGYIRSVKVQFSYALTHSVHGTKYARGAHVHQGYGNIKVLAALCGRAT